MPDLQSATVRVLDLPQNGELVGRTGTVIAQSDGEVFVSLPPDEFPYILNSADVEVVA